VRKVWSPILALTLTSLVTIARPAGAAETADVCHGVLPPLDPADLPLNKTNTSRIVIRGQVQLGISHANRGVEALRASSFEDAIKNIRLSYYNLRYAGSGVELALEGAKNRRLPDPLLEMTDKAIQAAMEHIRYALTAAQACSQATVPQAVERLEHAIVNATEAENLL
jgi:hypothetical protein